MLFREDEKGAIAISQPTHAWISGCLARALRDALPEPLLLAAEQHDVAWLDWEIDPTFDTATGRPHLFRDIGVFEHAPMWRRGVERALAAWGAHVALLVSRHGGVIYRRFTTRHRIDARDTEAAQAYLTSQAPREAAWADALGLGLAEMDAQSDLIAFVDNLSLALCGELKAPLELELPDRENRARTLQIAPVANKPYQFTMSPWPFAQDRVDVEAEGLRLPAEGRFASEDAFRAWLPGARRVAFSARLTPG